jgi:hypothetical protein
MTRNARIALAPIALFLLAALAAIPVPSVSALQQEESVAPPEQPPAEQRPDEVQPAEPAPRDQPEEAEDPMQPPADVEPYGSEEGADDAEVGTDIEVQPPTVDDSGEQADETTDVLDGDADDATWYRDPLWVLVGLVALVVVVILVFSGRKR